MNLNETGVKHSKLVLHEDVLCFLRNFFPSHLCCKCPALASITIVKGLLEKISARVLQSNGDKEKAEESCFFFSFSFHDCKGIVISCFISV